MEGRARRYTRPNRDSIRLQSPRILYNNQSSYSLTGILGWDTVMLLLPDYVQTRQYQLYRCLDLEETGYRLVKGSNIYTLYTGLTMFRTTRLLDSRRDTAIYRHLQNRNFWSYFGI